MASPFQRNGTPLDNLECEYNGLNQVLTGATPCAAGRYFVYNYGQEVETSLASSFWEATMPWQTANALSTGYFYNNNGTLKELKLIHVGNMPRAISGTISSSGFSQHSGAGYLAYNYINPSSSTTISISRTSSYIKINSSYFYTNTFHTTTIPNTLVLVACGAGGGGAGGNGYNGTYYYGGGGGGGGGVVVLVLDVLNYTFSITIGAGGSGGALGYNGSKGTDTVIKSYRVGSSTVAGTFTATGGSGGYYSSGTGGSGGLPSGGTSNGMYQLYTASGARGGNGGSSTGSYASKGNNFSWEFDPVLYDNGNNDQVLSLNASAGGTAYTTHRCNGGGGGASLAQGGNGSSSNTSGTVGVVGGGGGGGGLSLNGKNGGGGAIFIFY